MERVVKYRLLNIAKEKHSLKRRAFYNSLSLDELLASQDGSFIEKFLKAEDDTFDLLVRSELAVALSSALDLLSFRQRELCRLLGDEGLNVKQASRHLNVPRSTLREEIKRIRKVFKDKGLDEYLV